MTLLTRSPQLVVSDMTGYSPTYPDDGGKYVANRLTRRDGTIPLLVFLHGANNNADFAIITGNNVLVPAQRGFHTLYAADGGVLAFTNDRAMTCIADAIAYGRAKFGVRTGKVAIYAQSMGTAQALIYAANHPNDVAALALALAAPNLEAIRAGNLGGYQATIEAAYGGNAAWQALRPTRNPTDLPVGSWAGIPKKMWTSSDDPLAQPSIAAAFGAANGIPVVDFGAHGHSTTGLDVDSIMDWILSVIA